MNRLDNKVAIITGGARDQGAAEAELFVAAGAKVVITDIDRDFGSATADRLGEAREFVEHDVASEKAWTHVVRGVVEHYGRIDVLVNNAGIFRVLGLEETSLEIWNQQVAINQTSVFLGMRTVAPVMKDKGPAASSTSPRSPVLDPQREHTLTARPNGPYAA